MATAKSGQPNVVYLHSHDTGRCVQPYGYPVETPSIQRLANQGVLFRQAFSAAPTCSPGRAALLTGQAPHNAGMLGLAHRGFGLYEPAQHLAHTLRDNGYRTILAGTQHVTSADPAELGYDTVNDLPDAAVATVAPAAARTIADLSSESPAKPFFLDIGFSETHRPFRQVNPSESRYVQPLEGLPDAPETRFDTACFLASVRELDRGVGIVIDALGEAGFSEKTLVMLTTEHGPAFPGMKGNLNDRGIGVMLIIRGPNGFEGGRVVDALVSQVDLFPTICGVTGIERRVWLQGVSIVPIIDGFKEEIRERHYSEMTFHAAYEPQRAIRSPRWTYIRRFGDRRRPVLSNCDDGPSKGFLLRHGWQDREIGAEELFDNALDPLQLNNLAGNPQHAEVQQALALELAAWMEARGDPLLNGEVPLPPGAAMNDPDSVSATEELIVADADGSLFRAPNPEAPE